MAAIADADVSIDTSGNIRWTGAATTNRHTVLEFIQWLMLKQDELRSPEKQTYPVLCILSCTLISIYSTLT